MTASPSSPTESIPTFSIRGRNLPIISFVGRPGDARKGLITLVDALELLLKTAQVPRFTVWIVGGSERELALIEGVVRTRARVAGLAAAGELMLWGRVATEALPELYARSSLVVIPSSREQFGIVAAEAMMCGTPVVASRAGGLADAVLDGYAGTLVAIDDSSSLANAIAGYLRSPERVRRVGENARHWSRVAFARENTYGALVDLYEGRQLPQSFPSREDVRRTQFALLQKSVRTALGQKAEIEPMPQAGGIAAMARRGRDRFFCRLHEAEAVDLASFLPLSGVIARQLSVSEYAHVLAFHAENPAVLRAVVAPDAEPGAAIFPWRSPAPADAAAVRRLTAQLRAYRRISDDDPAGRAYLDALQYVAARRTFLAVERHDAAAAELNARVSGARRLEIVHPHVELLRLQLLLRQPVWILPDAVRERFDSTIAVVQDQPFAIDLPRVCHGDLRPGTLLQAGRGHIVAGDPRRSHYAVGPYDEALYVWHELDHLPQAGPRHAVSRLHELLSAQEIPVAVCWLLVFMLHAALRSVVTGGSGDSSPTMRFCRDLQHLWLRGVTR